MKIHETLKIMPKLSQEQIDQAREVDLLAYLLSHESGVLKQEGANYRHNEHDSLVYVASKNYWYWNSRGRKINAVDYLMEIRGYSFVGGCGTADRQRNPCCFSLYSFRQPGTAETGGEKALPPPQGETLCHLCCFLSPTPGSPFGHHQTVYAVGPFYESRYNNEAVCVFVGRDDTGTGRFACVRGIAGDLKKRHQRQ